MPWIRSQLDLLRGWLLHRVPYWLRHREISNTPAARAVILVPLIGYWIIFSNELHSLTKLVPWLGDGTESPDPPYRLLATYFGLCLIAVASAVYQSYCPAEIKQYATGSNYVGTSVEQMSPIELQRIEEVLRHGDEESAARLEGLLRVLERQYPDPEVLEQTRLRAKRNVLQLHFDFCNRSAPIARAVVHGCYIVGTIALLMPALDIFARVTWVLVRKVV